jgi:hypothetical protein
MFQQGQSVLLDERVRLQAALFLRLGDVVTKVHVTYAPVSKLLIFKNK